MKNFKLHVGDQVMFDYSPHDLDNHPLPVHPSLHIREFDCGTLHPGTIAQVQLIGTGLVITALFPGVTLFAIGMQWANGDKPVNSCEIFSIIVESYPDQIGLTEHVEQAPPSAPVVEQPSVTTSVQQGNPPVV